VTSLLHSELRKLLATPATWWLLLATAAVGVLGTLAPLIAFDGKPVDLLADRQIRTALHGAAGGAVLVLVAGILGMAGEWRFGQISQTLLSTPRRDRLVVVKTALFSMVGLAYGSAAALAAGATAGTWYAQRGVTLPVSHSSVWLTLLGCVVVSGLFGMVGVAVGAVVRRPVPAIVGTLAWVAIIEPALFAASPSTFRWLPGIASLSLRRQPAEHLLAPPTAAIVLLVLLLGAVVAGVIMVERDDVTA